MNTTVSGQTVSGQLVAEVGFVNVKTFDAKGDGVTNDTSAIQLAISYCQTNNYALYFPSGTYIVTALDFGNWQNFAISGDGSGSAGITGNTGLTVIFSKNANASVAFDFSGSSYGTVNDIAFITDNTVNCCVLLARTTGNSISNYGSDIVFDSCNFSATTGGGSVKAVIVSHSAEVITFNNCRIQYPGVPAFVFTSRASSFWGVTSAYHTAITSGFSLTLIRFYGGEITGNNAMAVVLDASSAISGADITINACYAGVSGSNTYLLQALTGDWNNIAVQSTRVEVTSAGTNYGGINLANNSTLTNVDIQMDVTSGNFITGTGSIVSGYLNSAAPINITSGTLGWVILTTPNRVNITCPTIQNCKVLAQPGAITALSASKTLEVDDGNGGVIVSFQPLFNPGSVTYKFPSSGVTTGLYVCSYSGASVGIWYTTVGGTPSATKIWTAANGVGILSTGTLTGAQSNFTVKATFNNNGDHFTVRRSHTALFAG